MDPAAPPPQESLAFALHRATVLVDRAADLFLRSRHDLSYPLFSVLLLIGHNDRPTQREIADMLGVSRASITQRVAELTRRGLIVTQPSPVDARALNLSLTPAGGALLTAAWQDLESTEDGIDDGIDVAPLIRQLDTITANADAFIRTLQQEGKA